MKAYEQSVWNATALEVLRVPPHSIDSEQAVLGGLMLSPNALDKISYRLTEEDFYRRDHRLIWRAIVELSAKGMPCDAVTMGDWFDTHGMAEMIGGASYLIKLANDTPSAANIQSYAEIVREKSILRQLIDAGVSITEDAYRPDGKSVKEILQSAGQRVFKISEASDRGTLAAIRPVKAYMGEALSEMQKLCDDENAFVGLPTGLSHLDEVTAGLEPATLIMVAARPSMGKTALAIQLAVRNALRRKRVAVFEIEMSGKRLTQRAVSLISGIPYSSIRRPKTLGEEDWPKIVDAYAKLEKSALIIDESSSQTAESICARAKQLHMQEPLSLVVIDHLGLVRLPGKTLEAIETGHVTTQFKALAKDLDIPVIVLVQLNRKVEERHDKRPLLSDLRDSGRIEEDADIVVMIYRDDYYNPDSQDRGLAELLVRKNRDGEVKNITIKARLDIMRFETYEGETHVKPKRTVIGFSGYADGKAKAAGND